MWESIYSAQASFGMAMIFLSLESTADNPRNIHLGGRQSSDRTYWGQMVRLRKYCANVHAHRLPFFMYRGTVKLEEMPRGRWRRGAGSLEPPAIATAVLSTHLYQQMLAYYSHRVRKGSLTTAFDVQSSFDICRKAYCLSWN